MMQGKIAGMIRAVHRKHRGEWAILKGINGLYDILKIILIITEFQKEKEQRGYIEVAYPMIYLPVCLKK